MDTAGAYNFSGLLFAPDNFNALYTDLQCDTTLAPAVWFRCTASLLDIDDFVNKVNNAAGQVLISPSDTNRLRRRLVLTARHCTRPGLRGNLEFYPYDDPAVPNLVGFRYDTFDTPGRTRFQDLPAGTCAGMAPPNRTMNVVSTAAFPLHALVTLGVTGGAVNATDQALMLVNESFPAVPLSEVPNSQLLRLVQTFPNTKLLSRDLRKITVAGFGMAGFGSEELSFRGGNVNNAVNGPFHRMTVTLDVTSVDATTIDAKLAAGSDGQSVCFGDSGSAALFEPTLGNRTAYGTDWFVFNPWCRGIAAFARLGEFHWWNWAGRVLRAYLDGGLAASQRERLIQP